MLDIALAKEDGRQVLTGFGRPFGLGRDCRGALLVTDMDLHVLFRFAPDLSAFQWLRDGQGWQGPVAVRPGNSGRATCLPAGLFNGPHSVAVMPDNSLVVTCYYTPGLTVLDDGGAVLTQWRTLSGGMELTGPATGVLCNQTGGLLVTEYSLNAVFLVDHLSGFARNVGVAKRNYDRPHMSVRMPNGDIVTADTWNDRLIRVGPNGRLRGILTDAGGWRDGAPARTPRRGSVPPLIDKPVALDCLDDGRLLVTCWGSGRVYDIDHAGTDVRTCPTGPLNKPYDARLLDQRLYVANAHDANVIIVDPAGGPKS